MERRSVTVQGMIYYERERRHSPFYAWENDTPDWMNWSRIAPGEGEHGMPAMVTQWILIFFFDIMISSRLCVRVAGLRSIVDQ